MKGGTEVIAPIKTWAATQAAKGATWLMHWVVGWVKGETPEYAMAMRRRTKAKIFKAKVQAIATASEADDIAPLAAEVYMGFETMRQAQAEAAEIIALVNDPVWLERGPAVSSLCRDVREKALAIVRILDEQEDDG